MSRNISLFKFRKFPFSFLTTQYEVYVNELDKGKSQDENKSI